MKYDNLISKNNEIDLKKLIKLLKKEKLIIFLLCTIFFFTGLLVSHIYVKSYSYSFTFGEIKKDNFLEDPYFIENYQIFYFYPDLIDRYNENFKENLLKKDNIINFIKENKKEFKNVSTSLQDHTSKSNILIDLNLQKINDHIYKFEVFFNENLDLKVFFDRYLFYIKKQSDSFLRTKLQDFKNKEIQIYKKHLKIAKDLNIHEFVFTERFSYDALYLQGQIALSGKIGSFYQDLEKLDNYETKYEPKIRHSELNINQLYKKIKIIILFFFLGLLTSLIIVIFKKR